MKFKQMRRWKAWEEETHTLDYQVANGNSTNFISFFIVV